MAQLPQDFPPPYDTAVSKTPTPRNWKYLVVVGIVVGIIVVGAVLAVVLLATAPLR